VSSTARPYRSKDAANNLVGLSISYQRENLLARGFGLEHLREILLRIARPLLRQGANLAYGGHWKEEEGNFTYELLRLISAEQEDNTLGGPDTSNSIGRLYNHSSWPRYLAVTPAVEAEWINCCRIVRVTQADAGFTDKEIVPDEEARDDSDRLVFNAAVTISAMRRFMAEGMSIAIPDVPSPERVPPISARIILGGKLDGYSGFVPGIFEEALTAMEHQCPLYIVGGFGGAAELLALALAGTHRPKELTVDWHRDHTPSIARLERLCDKFRVPEGARTTAEALEGTYGWIEKARAGLATALNTGLSEEETKELLTTRDMVRVVQLVRQGLQQRGLKALPA
jgi:hypothetical protein